MNTLQDEIESVINGYSRSTATSMIVEMIKDKFDNLLAVMQSEDWGYDGNWTEAMNETMENWIEKEL